jgi:hypothetical protein
MPAKLSDGLFIAVDSNGEVCCGANRSGPKLYIHESVAKKKAGKGGMVFKVTNNDVTCVWFEPKTFFLNERHEISEEKCRGCSGGGCRVCGYD